MATRATIGATFPPEAIAQFEVSLRAFADSLTANFASLTKAQPEDQLKAPVGALVAAAGNILGKKVVTRTEVRIAGIAGRPDFGVDVAGLPNGNLELKAPGKGARPDSFIDKRDREQWERFQALPNLAYTDGQEWAAFRSGELVAGPVKLASDPTRAGAAGISASDAAPLLSLLAGLLGWEPTVPSTPDALASMLAPLTRVLRDEVAADTALGGPMASLAKEWRLTLMPDASDADFADSYAQTFTYALLLGRLEGATAPLDAEKAAKQLDQDHALLAQVLRVLGQPGTRDAIGMPVGLLERVIGAVDAAKLSKVKDLWLAFYEDFLAAYDPVQRSNRGVYFTPFPVVSAQVRLAGRLLVDRMGLAQGYADPTVVLLDPAAGTGTYPLKVVAQACDEAERYGGPGFRAEIATRLSANLHAFELLVGPYAVTHLRLSRALADAGATLPKDGVRVYLTDTLASPTTGHAAVIAAPLFSKPLAEEQERASEVKAHTRVVVCIGNPPYDRDTSGISPTGRRKGGMIRYDGLSQEPGLIRDFLDPLPQKVKAEHGLNLYNDYVYFWRWAIWKVAEQNPDQPGIVSFITASSYLSGPAYAGMREVMRRRFDELWILNLGGEGRGSRKEDNVFEGVLTPVAIAIGLRLPGITPAKRSNSPAKVFYRRLRGSRKEKYEHLDTTVELEATDGWERPTSGWGDEFIPPSTTIYSAWSALTDVLPWTARGIQFSRTWPVSESQDVLTQRWSALIDAGQKKDGGETQRQFLKRGKPSRDAGVDREFLSFLHDVKLPRIDSLQPGSPPDSIERVAWRSFDRQWCIADKRIIDMPRPVLWGARSSQQLFFTSADARELTRGPALIANTAVPDLNAFNNRGGFVLPAWRDRAATEPNITSGLLDALAAAYGKVVTAQDLFAYLFAILGTAAYVDRFAAELGQKDVRIPFTADAALFEEAVALGGDLLWWATYGDKFQPKDAKGRAVRRLPSGTAKNVRPVSTTPNLYPASFRYDAGTQTIHVGDGTFSPVSAEVWEFSVSGLSVVESWLGYRMRKRAGKPSSDLDKLRPTIWSFSGELLELLAVLEHLVNATDVAHELLDHIVEGPLIAAAGLPVPDNTARKAPTVSRSTEQLSFPT